MIKKGLIEEDIIQIAEGETPREIARLLTKYIAQSNTFIIRAVWLNYFYKFIEELHKNVKDDNNLYHIVSDCRFLKAYGEAEMKILSVRMKPFNKCWRGKNTPTYFHKVFYFVRNVLKKQSVINMTPFEKGGMKHYVNKYWIWKKVIDFN